MSLQRTSVVTLRVAVAVVLALGAVRTSLFTVYRVAGNSMLETLVDGDRILVCDLPDLLGPVGVGDTVVLALGEEVLVKRIVAGPGDRVAMRNGWLLRNGELVPEAIPPLYRSVDDWPEAAIGPGEFFVLGDNRRVSVDSRDFGPVRLGQVLGTVVLRMARTGITTVTALERPPR